MKYALIAGIVIVLVLAAFIVVQLRSPFALARAGAVDRLEALLAANPRLVDARDGSDETPLMHAASHGRADSLKVLLRAGARPDHACRGGGTALMLAAGAISPECVSVLLDAGAPVNAADDTRVTALHFAARQGHVEVVRRLLKGGADRSLRDVAGRTPADVAKESGHLDLARELSEVVSV
jgi:uncharacterized protein